jgi:NAD-dependent protein deacetylase/lipoamidase
VLSGAGMSAESGIPTFRSGPGALWRKHRPETLATPEAFARDPELVWQWYGERIDRLDDVRPNAGHEALVRIEGLMPSFTIVTQNVDGLHHEAGSRDVIELHGSIRRARCIACGAIDTTYARARPREPGVPWCACGAMLRPDVVWFGEALPAVAIERAASVAAAADVFLVAGTSAVVYPAAGLITVAKDAGAFVVEINPEATEASAACDIAVRAPVGQFLPLVADALAAELS